MVERLIKTVLLWGTYYIWNTLQWPWPSEINLSKKKSWQESQWGTCTHLHMHCKLLSLPLCATHPRARTRARAHKTQTDSFITVPNSRDNRASLNFFRVAQASNAWLLAVVVLPSVTLQGTSILFFFFFNPREKFKKVCLPWLCYLMCTKGNVNPEYSTVFHTVIVPTLSCATQIRVLPKLLKLLKTSANQAQPALSISRMETAQHLIS